MAEIRTEEHNDCVGQIQIADDVLATIAGTAAMEVAGVAAMAGNITDIAELLGKKNLSKGVKVEVEGNEVKFELNLYIRAGYKIHEVCTQVQERVKNAIETMTGLEVPEINISVTGLVAEKDKIVSKKDTKVTE
jgi:uncharacterized alkaline shock family protein YloU